VVLTRVTRAGVEDVILELLSEDLHTGRTELREQLLRVGAEMPIDSLLLVEIVVRVEKRFGVRVVETAESARALRSVTGFADLIVRLIQDGDVEDGG
jgi:acyl carrier protein